jgi:hypothetical protein
MRPQAFLFVASLLAMAPPASAGLYDKVQNNIMDLVAKDSGAKSGARDIIQQQFELSPVPERITATDELLQKIHTASDPTEKAAAAVALAKLKSPWEASNHDDKVIALYRLYLDTKDPSLGRYLDDALSNAKGLYLDAINDFNSDNVSNPPATAAKFQRMADSFPKSRYASSSAYYLGQYWTRVGFIQNNFPDTIPKSDIAFTNFIRRSKDGEFQNSNFLTDASFFKALNRILVGKENEALAQLADMKKELGASSPNVYVYQLFYKTKDKSTEVDRYIPAQALIDATVKFIQANPGQLPGAQSDLAKLLLSPTKS